jgi:hypothetical protein
MTSKTTKVREAARDAVRKGFSDGFNSFFPTAARITPNGSTVRAVDMFLAAARDELDWRQRTWDAQMKRPPRPCTCTICVTKRYRRSSTP